MAHIHAELDFVVSAFIVHPTQKAVALIKHKKLGTWLPPGGHIELGEDSDAALIREVLEETGLGWGIDYEVFETKEYKDRRCARIASPTYHNSRKLWMPWDIEVHDFPPLPGHRHLCLVYLLFAKIPTLRLEANAHDGIMWFDDAMLDKTVAPNIADYCRRAIKTLHQED